MSFLDRLAAAVTPAASQADRAQARNNIERLAKDEPWLESIVTQHKEIEQAFAEARNASGTEARRRAAEQVAILLTAHATAEEAVVYPAIAEMTGKTQATLAYEEHSMTKVQLAKLRDLDPMSGEWKEKLEHIEGAVQQHVYEEENGWLPDLAEKLPQQRKRILSERYADQYTRYDKGVGAQRSPDMVYTSA